MQQQTIQEVLFPFLLQPTHLQIPRRYQPKTEILNCGEETRNFLQNALHRTAELF